MQNKRFPALAAFFFVVLAAGEIEPLTGTKPLTMEGDLASQMVDGIDRFLLNEISKSTERRTALWKLDDTSPEALQKSIAPHRERLAKMLGVRDKRVPFDAPQLLASADQPSASALVGKGDGFDVYAIRWPVLFDPQSDRKIATLHGEGLLLVPTGRDPVADVIAIPHCDQTPEQIVGLVNGVPAQNQFARRLAEAGCRVVVPVLIDRENYLDGLTRREYLYRAAFELGRHVVGYEIQKVLSVVDWFEKSKRKIGVIGQSDGAMLALHSGALDPRIGAVCAVDYFGPRERCWEEPVDRNVFGRLNEFGDSELVKMIFPRSVIIEHVRPIERQWNGRIGAPARLQAIPIAEAKREYERACAGIKPEWCNSSFGLSTSINTGSFLNTLLTGHVEMTPIEESVSKPPKFLQTAWDPNVRQLEQFNEMDRHNQALLLESENVRAAFIKPLTDAANKSSDAFAKAAAEFRAAFYNEKIGRFDYPLKPANVRTRKIAESEKWTRYEVVLDVFDDVFAYGMLIVPKGIKAGERRAVVVCQHGLEGRPIDVIAGDSTYYHDFATRLSERGYITFAPQNPYIFKDRFRSLQRKSYPIGKTLFSIIVPQHQQIVNWLKTQPNVDPDRIGFYGLSYGGKTAMRVPAIITDYALSICSGDFNEWVWKNAATGTFAKRYTYANKGEYEIFEWDLGSTFNYFEMALLIAPRPFMVERGHADGVAPDEAVAYEYSKVRRFYAMNLKQPARTRIEWFNGPHRINGVGTFDFLDEWLSKK